MNVDTVPAALVPAGMVAAPPKPAREAVRTVPLPPLERFRYVHPATLALVPDSGGKRAFAAGVPEVPVPAVVPTATFDVSGRVEPETVGHGETGQPWVMPYAFSASSNRTEVAGVVGFAVLGALIVWRAK